MATSQKQRMLAGALYRADDPEIRADAAATFAWLARYNAGLALPRDRRHALLRERLAEVGTGAEIRPPSTATTASTSASGPAPS